MQSKKQQDDHDRKVMEKILIETIHQAACCDDLSESDMLDFKQQERRFELHNRACDLCLQLLNRRDISERKTKIFNQVLQALIASELELEITAYKEMIALLKEG